MKPHSRNASYKEFKSELTQAVTLTLHSANLARKLIADKTLDRSRKVALRVYLQSLKKNERSLRSVMKQTRAFSLAERLRILSSKSALKISLQHQRQPLLDSTFSNLESSSILLRNRVLKNLEAKAEKSPATKWIARPMPYLTIREKVAWENLALALKGYQSVEEQSTYSTQYTFAPNSIGELKTAS